MGERAKQESWQGKGMEGKCLGSMRKTAETGNVSPRARLSKWLLSGLVSDLVSSSLISQGSLRRNQSSPGCRSSSDIS